ncbi:unnamed protein product [Vitrella brassicaformis CCMP3155]|uniref:Uncharacterized protein n=1 Tax=Vitrella brassicaformis (strain CCMP3155) TaxID=1169540 RepID=A0A0G4FMR0_VITBC|nr:unnamed protein product [Vitrella brassicaformis CCMP3155]|eukprot:CEM14868.1 unnamed protein product [Vitrella brassicaformis CCMP3155]
MMKAACAMGAGARKECDRIVEGEEGQEDTIAVEDLFGEPADTIAVEDLISEPAAANFATRGKTTTAPSSIAPSPAESEDSEQRGGDPGKTDVAEKDESRQAKEDAGRMGDVGEQGGRSSSGVGAMASESVVVQPSADATDDQQGKGEHVCGEDTGEKGPQLGGTITTPPAPPRAAPVAWSVQYWLDVHSEELPVSFKRARESRAPYRCAAAMA